MKPGSRARGVGGQPQATQSRRGSGPSFGPLPEAEGLFAEGRTAEVKDDSMPSWESQVAQYPRIGQPGMSYFRGRVTDDYYVDCLLYRNDDGELVGILNHYPEDFPPYERKGNVNIWVHPDHRKKGIGTELGLESLRRWEPRSPDSVRYTRAGLEWVTAVGRRYVDTDLDFRAEGWQAWHDRVVAHRDEPESAPPEEQQ